ncbi:MAG TPA: hypothetical protein DFR83_11830 [Deltaproteobacteria bacterium]|nr:hypothetical protein [Deltaproteobacteria bacterium]
MSVVCPGSRTPGRASSGSRIEKAPSMARETSSTVNELLPTLSTVTHSSAAPGSSKSRVEGDSRMAGPSEALVRSASPPHPDKRKTRAVQRAAHGMGYLRAAGVFRSFGGWEAVVPRLAQVAPFHARRIPAPCSRSSDCGSVDGTGDRSVVLLWTVARVVWSGARCHCRGAVTRWGGSGRVSGRCSRSSTGGGLSCRCPAPKGASLPDARPAMGSCSPFRTTQRPGQACPARWATLEKPGPTASQATARPHRTGQRVAPGRRLLPDRTAKQPGSLRDGKPFAGGRPQHHPHRQLCLLRSRSDGTHGPLLGEPWLCGVAALTRAEGKQRPGDSAPHETCLGQGLKETQSGAVTPAGRGDTSAQTAAQFDWSVFVKFSNILPVVVAVGLPSLGCSAKNSDQETGPSTTDVGSGDEDTTASAEAEGTSPGECADGEDNDQDGLLDCEDPDCTGDEACIDDIEGECSDGTDNDGDGRVDCEDEDCAGSPDCDEPVVDADGDGVPADADCDDADATMPINDADCDGIPTDEDCNDTDATMPANDADCDGAPTTSDCNDSDPAIYPFAGDSYGDGVDSDCDGLDCEAGVNGSNYLTVCSDSGALKTWSESFDSCTSAGYIGLATLDDPTDQAFLYAMNGIVDSCNIWVDPTNQGTSTATTGCQEINHTDGALDTTDFCGSSWFNCQYACEVPMVSDTDEDGDGDGYPLSEDCDDTDASIHPFAGDTYGDGVDSDCDGLDCEAASDGSTYMAVCDGAETWTSALTTCSTAGYSSLGTILSSTEHAFAEGLILAQASTGGTEFWFGWNQRDLPESDWEFESGLSSSYTNWHPGEPDDNGGADCGRLLSTHSYRWGDAPCDNSAGFICELR